MTQRIDHAHVAPAGMKALGGVYGYVQHSVLPEAVLHLVFLRASQINGCSYCIDMHSHDLMKAGAAIEKVLLVSAWREAEGMFDAREQVALAWTETVTAIAQTHVPDSEFEAARAVFSEKELVDLTIAIGVINAYNRLAISFRAVPASALRSREAA